MRRLLGRFFYVCLLLAVPLLVAAQSDVGGVTGTVTDNSGAVVPNATVELKDNSTNQITTAHTNNAGQYTFSRVEPGTYTLTAKASNFSTAVIANLKVNVGKTATSNIVLKVGSVEQIVEVQAGAATELQTQDASVGAVLTNQDLRSIPNLGRDATGLVLLQPGAMPLQSGDENSGGQIMGARSDQNTFMLDGGDISNSTDGLGSYAGRNNFSGSPHGAVPTPVDSLEEFRVVTNNNMGGFNRSAGAEVQMVTRRGTNNWHGNLYDYGIYDETNAADWSFAHTQWLTQQAGGTPKPKPEWRDNRFGGSFGGPIFKDKTFFFLNVESRHFLKGNTLSRWTPTSSMLAGNIGYKTTSGSYNFVPIASLDPLGIGMNQTVLKLWKTMPAPNSAGGDGANFGVFTGAAPLVTNSESVVGRIDHQLTQNWHVMGSYRYGVEDNSTTNQTLMTSSGFKSLSSRPVWGNYAVGGVTGQLTPHLTNDAHFNFTRLYWKWGTSGDLPQVAGLGGALQIRSESNTSAVLPYNVDTQQTRQRLWDGKDYNVTDTLSWMKGNHFFSFTGRFGWQRFTHMRNDKVTGGTTYPIYYDAYTTTSTYPLSGIPFPADMDSTYKGNFGAAYVSALGIITRATQVLTRDGSLTPNPRGTWITAKDIVDNWSIGFNDAWKIKPSLTLSYGLTWSVELPPYSPNGTQTMEVDAATGKVFSVDQYLGTKASMLSQGQWYNPVIGFAPIKGTGRKYPFDPDYTNLGPRLALAWNPSASSGIFGHILGEKKTVIRAGWSRNFDRLNGVDLVMTPALGVGFADLAICKSPKTDGSCGGAKGTPTTAFRIGTNGNSITIPGLAPVTAPVIPGTNAPFSAVDWHIDPRRQVGSTDVLTLSIQREMPSNMMLEVGFVGRISRDLYEKVDLNNVPYMFKMGGQTFAQAYDALQMASIQDPTGNTFATQPFFEAALKGSSYCTGYATCTAAVMAQEGPAGNGYLNTRDVSDTFSDLEGNWAIGNGSLTQFGQEVYSFDTTTSRGKGRYAGAYFMLRRGGKNVSFQANYTLSKSLDSYGWNQDIIDTMQDAYNPNRSYGPSLFDRRHVFNGWMNWQLPIGRGQRWLNSGGVVDKVLGGWGSSFVFSAGSGVPNMLVNGNVCGTEFGGGLYSYSDCSSLLAIKPGSWNLSRHNNPTVVAGGFGSDSLNSKNQIIYNNGFANPGIFATAGQAGSNFRYPLFADPRAGNQNWMRGMGYWNFDMSMSKTTRITEKLTMKFSADLINAFNHPNMADPSTDISSSNSFGVLTGTQNIPRYIQWGIRFDF